MKRKTSKEVLAESFREIAEHKNVDKITIKDITENCGYSPATFYRQFKDKYDLIAWDYTRGLKDILSEMNGSIDGWHQTLMCVAEFFQKNKTYLANLFLHTSGFESFITNMQEVNFRYLKDVVQKASGSQSLDVLTEMHIRLYVLGTAQFTCEWILGKWEINVKELVAVYEQTLPESVEKYLF